MPFPILAAAMIGSAALSALQKSKEQSKNSKTAQAQFNAQQKQQQAETALNATQMDPLTQQRSRQKAALMEQLMKNMSPVTYADGKFSGGLNNIDPAMFKQIASYFSPEARGAAEGHFNSVANAASGGSYGMPDYSALGYPQGAVKTTTPMPTAGGSGVDPEEQARRRYKEMLATGGVETY